MVVHVLAVPVTLQPVLRGVLLHKVVDSVPEVVWLQQKQLDDEVANLSLVSFMAAHRLDIKEKTFKDVYIVKCCPKITLNVSVMTSPNTK